SSRLFLCYAGAAQSLAGAVHSSRGWGESALSSRASAEAAHPSGVLLKGSPVLPAADSVHPPRPSTESSQCGVVVADRSVQRPQPHIGRIQPGYGITWARAGGTPGKESLRSEWQGRWVAGEGSGAGDGEAARRLVMHGGWRKIGRAARREGGGGGVAG